MLNHVNPVRNQLENKPSYLAIVRFTLIADLYLALTKATKSVSWNGMKNRALAIFLGCYCLIAPAVAKEEPFGLTVGIKSGLITAKLTGDEVAPNHVYGGSYSIGVMALFDQFHGFYFGLSKTTKGYAVERFKNETPISEEKIFFHYAQGTAVYILRPATDRMLFGLGAGFYYGSLTGVSQENTEFTESFLLEQFSHSDLGLDVVLQAGRNFANELDIFFEYEFQYSFNTILKTLSRNYHNISHLFSLALHYRVIWQ